MMRENSLAGIRFVRLSKRSGRVVFDAKIKAPMGLASLAPKRARTTPISCASTAQKS
jgi:hypothetical protein